MREHDICFCYDKMKRCIKEDKKERDNSLILLPTPITLSQREMLPVCRRKGELSPGPTFGKA
jgi:hypothetical protein